MRDNGEHGDDYPCPQVEATIEVELINLNDNPPVCSQCMFEVEI